MLQIVRPGFEHLASYVHALQRGWSPDNVQPEVARLRELSEIRNDARAFLDSFEDLEARGGPITMSDGTKHNRLPGFRRWLWDGELCGSIGFRWQPGTSELPAWVPGHIGYGVVPWKRQRGYATEALRLLLIEIEPIGLEWVDLTTDPTNVASHKVIQAARGKLLGPREKDAGWGGGEEWLWRIDLRGRSHGQASGVLR